MHQSLISKLLNIDHHARNLRQELATGLAGQNIDLVPVFDCLGSGQPEVGLTRECKTSDAKYCHGCEGGEDWM